MQTPSQSVQGKNKLVIQGLLSAWAIFHVLAVLITPNRNSYLGKALGSWMEPYANFLELSANWNFFAPQPGPPIRLEFEAVDAQGAQLVHDFWPALDSPWRQSTLSHFVMKDPNGGDRLMGNFLCHRNPGSHSIRMWRNTYGIPSLEEVATSKKKIGDDSRVVRQFMGEWRCSGRRQTGEAAITTAEVKS
jgi:hypothetical protein